MIRKWGSGEGKADKTKYTCGRCWWISRSLHSLFLNYESLSLIKVTTVKGETMFMLNVFRFKTRHVFYYDTTWLWLFFFLLFFILRVESVSCLKPLDLVFGQCVSAYLREMASDTYPGGCHLDFFIFLSGSSRRNNTLFT